MNRFIEVVPLTLTPLTPIHIGCGEDFEPTNYVIEGNTLYHFEPSRLSLTEEDGRRLIRAVNAQAGEAIREVQRFFFERRSVCRQASRLAVSVAESVAERYQERVGRIAQREARGRSVVNRLEIERTAHHPHSGRPYVPGSSLKGSMRTGWLNDLDKGPPIPRDRERGPSHDERSPDIEAKMLGGSFQSDPFRLVQLADAAGKNVRSRVLFGVNRPKHSPGDRAAQGPPTCCEAIIGGQLRCLSGEIRFLAPRASARPPNVPQPKGASAISGLWHAPATTFT